MQLEMIRKEDSERLGVKADLIDELSPCAVTTPLSEPPDTKSVIDETQRQIDAAFATTEGRALLGPSPTFCNILVQLRVLYNPCPLIPILE